MFRLSIIIVNFNTKDLTLNSLKSIYKSGIKYSFETIVVDNGSNDGSVVALRNLKLKTKNLKLVENKQNLGFAKANNQGIKKAIGKYVLLLNSDTKVPKDTVNKLLDFSEKTSNLGIVGPKLLNPDGSIQGSVFRLPTLSRTIEQYWFGKKRLLDKYAPDRKGPVEVEALSMACVLLTPECIKKAGLLNEKYFMYFEDLDYCRKIRKTGLKIYYLPSAEVVHYHGASGKNLLEPGLQWKRQIPSSKIYHGAFKHYLVNIVIWFGQKINKI